LHLPRFPPHPPLSGRVLAPFSRMLAAETGEYVIRWPADVLQCVVLQCVAVCHNVLQCVAVAPLCRMPTADTSEYVLRWPVSVLQFVAVCYSVL